MFADDSNLFYYHKSIKISFKNANDELEKIFQWFKANKILLNEGETKLNFTNYGITTTFHFNFQTKN